MNILILDRHDLGGMFGKACKGVLSYYDHNVDYEFSLECCDKLLSEYNVVIAHPIKRDLKPLYDEANNRNDFRLIFFNTKTLDNVNPNDEFKNKNVFFEEKTPRPSRLLELINN